LSTVDRWHRTLHFLIMDTKKIT